MADICKRDLDEALAWRDRAYLERNTLRASSLDASGRRVAARDDERPWDALPKYDRPWDGHSQSAKWARVQAFLAAPVNTVVFGPDVETT